MNEKYSFDELLKMILYNIEEVSEKVSALESRMRASIESEYYRLYTPRQVSEILDVNYSTVLDWIKKGKLVTFTEGGEKFRVTGLEIRRFIDKSKKYQKATLENQGIHPAMTKRKQVSDYVCTK